MTKWIVGLGLAALAFCSPPAVARTTIIEPEGARYPYQRWVDEARVPTPAVTLSIVEEPCESIDDWAPACTRPGSYTIWMAASLRPRATLWHEVGHNFDYYTLPEWARQRFATLIAYSGPWQGVPNDGSERFAQAYDTCAALGPAYPGDPNLAIRGNGLGGIRNVTFRAICRMITRVGRL